MGITSNTMVLVSDASADPTVNSGSALYFYDADDQIDFVKVSEFESLDVTFTWASITDGPASTPAAVDAAVAATHTHANKTELDKIDETAGTPEYDGVPLVRWASTDW